MSEFRNGIQIHLMSLCAELGKLKLSVFLTVYVMLFANFCVHQLCYN